MWSHLQVQGREAAQKSKQSLGSVQFRQRSERETKVSRWHRFTRQLSRTSPASSSWVNVGWSLSSPPPLCMNVAPVQHLTDISLHQAALLVHRTKGRKGQNAHMYRWARALMKAQSSFEMLVQTHVSWFKSDVLELFQYELIHFSLGASGRLPFPYVCLICAKNLEFIIFLWHHILTGTSTFKTTTVFQSNAATPFVRVWLYKLQQLRDVSEYFIWIWKAPKWLRWACSHNSCSMAEPILRKGACSTATIC